MLYNPRWEQGVTELDKIISWLETQPPDETYGVMVPLWCLFGCYARATGVGLGLSLFHRHSRIKRESNRLYDNYRQIADPAPRTYGAALERARELRGW